MFAIRNHPTHEYIATAKCGCVVGLVADIAGQEKFTAQSVAGFIADGCAVERVDRTSQKFIDACGNIGHHCNPAQERLF